jgi:DNA-binding transcriptional MerR regulator
MQMSAQAIKKLYYSISEIADITGLKQYVLRYWETEFMELRPSKNRAGNRIYKEKDIRLIGKIKELLYKNKYTIEGARNSLKKMQKSQKTAHKNKGLNDNNENLIDAIQAELEDVLNILDDRSN